MKEKSPIRKKIDEYLEKMKEIQDKNLELKRLELRAWNELYNYICDKQEGKHDEPDEE